MYNNELPSKHENNEKELEMTLHSQAIQKSHSEEYLSNPPQKICQSCCSKASDVDIQNTQFLYQMSRAQIFFMSVS